MMPRAGTRLLLGALFCSLSACAGCNRDKSKPASAFIVAELPQGARATTLAFDGKIELVGYLMHTRGPMRPGRPFKLSLYWRAVEKPPPGFRLTTKLLDMTSQPVATLDESGPLRESSAGAPKLPPESWELGKIYVDELDFVVPPDLQTPRLQLVVGLQKGDERLKVSAGRTADPTSGLVVAVPTGFRPRARPAPIPTLRVDRLDPSQKIKIDGKLDEPAWTEATAGTLVDVATGQPNHRFPVNGSFRLLFGKEGFYVGFEVRDTDIVGGFKNGQKDAHLWTKDAVELMIDPDGDGDNRDYYEIQVNPQNLVFDTAYDDYNTPQNPPDGPFGHEEWASGVKSAVTLQGTLDKSDDVDQGYTVEALVPWKAFTKAKHSPPEIGDAWRMNFYAMQDGGGVSWSAILGQGNFHKASRFGRVLWAEKGFSAPEPEQAASPAPSGESPPEPNAAAQPSAPAEPPARANASPKTANSAAAPIAPAPAPKGDSMAAPSPARARVPLGSK
jgi:hypothetical protein